MQTIRLRVVSWLWWFCFVGGAGSALGGQMKEASAFPDSLRGFPGGDPWRLPQGDWRWSIEILRVDASAKSGDHNGLPLRVTVQQTETKEGSDFSQVQELADGMLLQTWALGAWVYHSREGDEGVARQVRLNSKAMEDPREGSLTEAKGGPPSKNWLDFAECRWIRPEFCVGVSRWAGSDYLVYQQASPEMARSIREGKGRWCKVAGIRFPLGADFRSALVHRESRLPRVVQNGGEFFVYEFERSGSVGLELPPKLRGFLRESQRRTREALSETIRPF